MPIHSLRDAIARVPRNGLPLLELANGHENDSLIVAGADHEACLQPIGEATVTM